MVELLVTLALVAILATVAIPSFQSMVRENRLASQANDLLSAFTFARSEAVKRGQAVSLCRVGSSFANGAEVRLGGACASTDTVLRASRPFSSATVTSNYAGASIPLTAMGLVDKSITFPKVGTEIVDIQLELTSDSSKRWLCINRTGRVYVTREAKCNS